LKPQKFGAAPRWQNALWGHPAQTDTLKEPPVQDQFDITLEDSDLLGDVELTTDLIIAATESDLPLSTDEIDRLLGIAQSVEN
jgi:hypothetical protein